MMFFDLPVELHEKILGYLHDLDLMEASQVCQLWYQLSESYCRRSVLNQVPDDVLEELRTELTPADDELAGEQPDADGRWTELYRRWMQSQLRGKRPWRVRNTHCFPFTVLALFADGPRLFAADSEGVLNVLSMTGCIDVKPSHRLYLHDGHINQIVPVWRLRLLVVTGADTHFILDGAPPRLLMCTENMSGQRRVSVHGDRLATMKDVYQRTCITVYRMSVDERWTRLQPLYDVHCPHAAFQWSLWRDQLICFLRSGELCVWDQAAAAWHRHPDAYTELRYENPAWVVRDTVLCSTLVQRQLMGYWHQDRDFTYWLQGRVSQPLVRAAPAFNENILCLCARRSLVVAGTQSGKLLFFHSGVRERGVPGRGEPDRGSVSDVKLTAPVCIIHLGFNAIESVTLGFSDYLLYVYVKSRKTMVELIEVAVGNLFRF